MAEPFGNKWKKYKIYPTILTQSGNSVDSLKLNTGENDLTGAQGVQGTTGEQGTQGTSGNTSGGFPIGGIIMWSGEIIDIPVDWALCDGTTPTPDLTDKFIVGAGRNYQPGDGGGSPDSVLVEHTHTAIVSDPGHKHNANADGGSTAATGPNFRRENNNTGFLATEPATTGITVSNSTEGVSPSGTNLPPYYALAYIMKIK